MSKKAPLFLILGFIIFIMANSIRADEQEERWIDHMIQQAAPNSQLPSGGIFGGFESIESAELTLMAIHNINTHFMKVDRLHAQGWSSQEIKAQFEAKLTHIQIGFGSISGKLTQKGGGAIQSFANVTAFNEFGHYCGSAYLWSSSDGTYRISSLLPGQYYVRVTSSYYENQYYRNATDWRKAKKVRVSKYKEKRNINFKLKINEKIVGNGAISGQATRKGGTPLKDCSIYVYDLDNRNINLYPSITDANGQYVVTNIPTGKYKVSCSFNDSGASMRIWYGNAQSFEEASIVTVNDPNTTTNINFVLEIGGIIKAKVMGPDGKPVHAYDCNVTAYDMNNSMIRFGNSDDKGKFILGFLPKGRYKLHVNYYGQENCTSTWYKNAKKFKSATAIHINPGQTKNLTIKLKRGGIITGKITGSNGQAISVGYYIEAYDDNGYYAKRGQTDASGAFWVRGLETGRYKLSVKIYDYPTVGSAQPVGEWYNGKNSFKDAAFIKVTASKTKSNINFSLAQGGYITCRVVDPYGYPLGYDASVYAYNSRFERVSSSYSPDYNGLFAINGLPSGTYRVRVRYYGDEGYLSEFYDDKLVFEAADNITVTAPNGTGNIVFELDYPAVLQGFLTDSKKKRVIDQENHPVDIYAFDAETGEFAGNTDNTFMSGYHFKLLEGNYKVAALSYYYNWMTDTDDFGMTYHPKGKKFNDPETKIHSAKSGSAKKLTSLALKKLKGSISGTFYDKTSGLAMTEGLYIVWVFDADGFLASLSGYLDSNNPISGEYRVGGLRPGSYYVLAAAISEFSDPYDLPVEWYGGVEVPQEELYTFTPKVEIPAGAIPISVSTGNTGGIDFYLDID